MQSFKKREKEIVRCSVIFFYGFRIILQVQISGEESETCSKEVSWKSVSSFPILSAEGDETGQATANDVLAKMLYRSGICSRGEVLGMNPRHTNVSPRMCARVLERLRRLFGVSL